MTQTTDGDQRGQRPVLVVIGVGGMGKAIARRVGSGKLTLLADYNDTAMQVAAEELRGDGHFVETCHVDVSDADSVAALATTAAGLGPVLQVAHTAGLSPVQAPAPAVLAVDLTGVALVLDAFERVIAPGGAGVVIASNAGHLIAGHLSAEQERALASMPAAELSAFGFADPNVHTNSGLAYSVAKRANQVRVQAAALGWGARGARINSISPGVIATPMSRAELAGASGPTMRGMVEASPAGRLGTAEEIAAAAAFLLGPDSSFVTGTDLLVDGGTVAALLHSPATAPRS